MIFLSEDLYCRAFTPRITGPMEIPKRNVLYFLQVDGKTNPKIQSIYLEKFPIFKACFSANGEEVLATSTHSKVLYVYDMLVGKLIPVHQVRGKISVETADYPLPLTPMAEFI